MALAKPPVDLGLIPFGGLEGSENALLGLLALPCIVALGQLSNWLLRDAHEWWGEFFWESSQFNSLSGACGTCLRCPVGDLSAWACIRICSTTNLFYVLGRSRARLRGIVVEIYLIFNVMSLPEPLVRHEMLWQNHLK